MLPDEELKRIWAEDIFPVVFEKSTYDQRPVTVFIGGQPGAGKTNGWLRAAELNQGHQITPIIGDDYRQYHPDYRRLVRDDPMHMPDATSPSEGRWIGMCVDYADQHGYSISIEGTWRNANTVLDEARKAKSLGRRTHALIVAAPPALTRARALSRFTEDATNGTDARWTPPAAQQAVFNALADNVRTISRSNLIDRFTVVSNGKVIHDAPTQDNDIAYRAWEQEYKRDLTADEKKEVSGKILRIHDSLPDLPLSPDDRLKVKAELDTVTKMAGKLTLSKADFRRSIEKSAERIRLANAAPEHPSRGPEGPSL